MVTGRKLMVLGLLFGASAAWGSTPRRALTNLQKQLLKTATASSETGRYSASSSCVDLSGHWKGSCMSSGQDGISVEAEEMTLKQEKCDKLTFVDDGDTLYIPGPTNISNVDSDGFASDATGISSWQSEGEMLKIYVSGTFSALVQPDFPISMVFAGVSDYHLVDGKLVTSSQNTQYDSFSAGSSVWNDVCEYELVTP